MVLVSGSFGLNQKYGALIPAMDIPVKISMEPNQTTKLQRMPSSSKPPFLGSMLIFQGVVDFRPLLKPEISSTEIFFSIKTNLPTDFEREKSGESKRCTFQNVV